MLKNMGNTRGIGCGLVVLALIAGAFLLFRGQGGGNDRIPQTGSGSSGERVGDEGTLGRPYVASEVDRNGCPAETTDEFASNEAIFVGYSRSEIPAGTQMFARLLYEGDPVEDTPPVTAEQDLASCVWFQFEPSGEGFLPGDYTAELFVNGNSADQLDFEVVDDNGNSGVFGGGGGSQNPELGRVTTTTQVDQSGCPVDRETSFYGDEAVYLAAQKSFIPAGTEVFARLIYEGDVVEDSQPIVADRDIQSCIWFVFEPSGQDFYPGAYTAEMYVNGSLVDQVPFEVR